MKKKTQYFCLLNKKEAIKVGLFGWSTSICHESEEDGNGTYIHKMWKANPENRYTKTNKSEYEKSIKAAMKILREKLKT